MLLACVYFLLLHVCFACYGNTFVNSLRVCTLLLSFPLAGDENILNTCGIGQCLLGLKLIDNVFQQIFAEHFKFFNCCSPLCSVPSLSCSQHRQSVRVCYGLYFLNFQAKSSPYNRRYTGRNPLEFLFSL